MTKKQWMSFDEVPEGARPLLAAYNQVFGLHHTNHVVRYMSGGEHPALQVQCYGQVSAGVLRKLEELAGCLVSIRACAPNYLIIMLFGAYPESVDFDPHYGKEVNNFLFRPYAR